MWPRFEKQIIDQPSHCSLSLAWFLEPPNTLTGHLVCPWTSSTWPWFKTLWQRISRYRNMSTISPASCFMKISRILECVAALDYSLTFTHFFFPPLPVSPSACSRSEFALVIIQEPRSINQLFHSPLAAFSMAISSIHHKQTNGHAAPNPHLLFHLHLGFFIFLFLFFTNPGFL